uniref:Uncharacterized protein n=1 Tax=Ditylenchus dipsaci TaxID=166011 RepID=A0A915CZJ8_9BILA
MQPFTLLLTGKPLTYTPKKLLASLQMSPKIYWHTQCYYEVLNEPKNLDWNKDLVPYHNALVASIRANDKIVSLYWAPRIGVQM